MFHVPIVRAVEHNREIEFSHIINDGADKNTWRDNPNISLDHVKINIFVRGEFSVVIDNECYTPVYGDICVLSPHRVHYGRISKPTKLEYYQLDIGIDAFHAVPGGSELLLSLSELSRNGSPFVRPNSAEGKGVLAACESISSAIKKENSPLAFAYTIEALAQMKEIYSQTQRCVAGYLSKHVSHAIYYINENYSQPITVYEIADLSKVSTSYLSRQFKKEIGVSVHEYITNLRVTKATKFLAEMSVAATAAQVGFCDSSHFISVFRKKIGITPSEYMKKR